MTTYISREQQKTTRARISPTFTRRSRPSPLLTWLLLLLRSEQGSIPHDEAMSVTLTVGQLRALIQHELAKVLRDKADDTLLTIDEAAQIMSVSPDWLYRHAPKLPFTRKLGHKMLRFSRLGIEKWLRTRAPS